MKIISKVRLATNFDVNLDNKKNWRLRRFFAFLPVTITTSLLNRETRFLERVTVVYYRENENENWLAVKFW